MTFRLEAEETLAIGLGRAAAEEIRRARGALLAEADPEAGVLEARKSLKKVRAILRLSRAPLGKRRFRAANHWYRDLTRRLAEQRAGAVRVETLEGLAGGLNGQAPMRVLRASRRRLVPRRRRYDDATVRADVAEALAEARPGIEALPIQGFDAVRPGITRTYRKGQKRMREAIERPSAAAFHDWRKRVKDLWYQIRLVGHAWPEPLGSLADELHLLSDHLGDGHDLDLLESALQDEARSDPLFDPSPLLPALDEERAAKRAAAIDLGRRLYAEDPEGFAARVEAYWQTWRETERPAG
jgi:CHAD domain-containing protein